MEIIKILALCFISAAICLFLRNQKSEFAILISVASGVIILLFLIKSIIAPITVIGQKIEGYGINSDYFKTAIKGLGIGYLTSFIADSCRDAGQAGLASKAELAGKCAIFILSLPLMFSILQTALGFIQ